MSKRTVFLAIGVGLLVALAGCQRADSCESDPRRSQRPFRAGEARNPDRGRHVSK